MKPHHILTFILLIHNAAHAANNPGAAPYLGWSSWSLEATKYPGYGGAWLTAEHVKAQADVLHDKLQAHGYTYVNIDSFWSDHYDEFGRPVPDAKRFPGGIVGRARYVHARGQKLGIYWVPGVQDDVYKANPPILGTRYHARDIVFEPQRPATGWGFGHKIDFFKPGAQEYVDSIARLFASWEIDFLKLDGVTPGSGRNDLSIDARPDVAAWSLALAKTARPIWLTLSWNLDINNANVWRRYANAWRIEDDVESYGDRLSAWGPVRRRFDAARRWSGKGGPGRGWNDCDSLPVGNGEMDGLSPDERRTAVTLWAIACSPLYAGDDLTKLDALGLELLSNDEVIAVQQAGHPATSWSNGDAQVWQSAQDDGSVIVGLFNLDGTQPQTVKATWDDLGVIGPAKVRDLWAHQDMGTMDGDFTATLAPHACRLMRITPQAGIAVTKWRWKFEGAGDALTPQAAAQMDTPNPDWQDAIIGQDIFDDQPGIAWYRATLWDPNDGPNVAHVLHFGNVDDNAEVYLNGQKVGAHEGYDTSFDVSLDAAWQRGRANELAVRVENKAGQGGMVKRVTLRSIPDGHVPGG